MPVVERRCYDFLFTMTLESQLRPRIGIPWRKTGEELGGITGKLQYYLDCIESAGGEPEPVSLLHSKDQLEAKLGNLDGFVLPGSPADVNPALYRSARSKETHDADPNREKTDSALIENAYKHHKPLLAICYGCQSLNVALGGTLYQDIPTELHSTIRHSKDGLPPGAPDPEHGARIDAGGELAQLAIASGLRLDGEGRDARINSSHHQSVRDLGHGLRIAAVAPDGVIEAVEHEPHKHWVVGVQWHPERMPGDALAEKLFAALVQTARSASVNR